MIDPGQQDTLLELLNTTPVTNGTPTDELADREAAKAWQKAHGGSGSTRELAHLVQARDALQEVVRGARPRHWPRSLRACTPGRTSPPTA